MNVIILESHANDDGRIRRHIQHLLDKYVGVYHLHFNFLDEQLVAGPFSYCGELGFRLNFKSNFKNKIRTFNYLIYSLTNGITEDSIKCFDLLNIDPNEELIIHVHDPILLPLSSNLIKSKFKSAKIVYDRHEVYENFPKDFGVNIFLNLEKKYSRFVSGVVVVSDSYKKDAKQLFPKAAIVTVPNFPQMTDYDQNIIDKKISSFDHNSNLNLVYIGGLNNDFDRDIDLLLKIAFKVLNHNENARFIVGGRDCPSTLEMKLHDYSLKFPDRIQYNGAIPPREKIAITEKAHIGFFLIKPRSHYWVKASPNKVFEYLICGVVPVIRADIDYSQEIDRLSLSFGRYATDDEILSSTLQLIEDPKRILDLMKHARNASTKFTWESVASRYIEFYGTIIEHELI